MTKKNNILGENINNKSLFGSAQVPQKVHVLEGATRYGVIET